MVPAAFIALPALPLTAHGKVDRKALPAPDLARIAQRKAPVLPRTAAEKTLARIWGAVLGVDSIGIDDNFFDLGGDSLMAARLMSRIRTASGIDLPLRNLFERPTVSAMAEAVDALSWSAKLNATDDAAGDREDIEL
jgi:acyl carrier protein